MPAWPQRKAAPISAISSSRQYGSEPKPLFSLKLERFRRVSGPVLWISSWKRSVISRLVIESFAAGYSHGVFHRKIKGRRHAVLDGWALRPVSHNCGSGSDLRGNGFPGLESKGEPWRTESLKPAHTHH